MTQQDVRRVPAPLLSAKEVAAQLGVAERTVTRLFRRKAIRAFPINGPGSPWRTTQEAVEQYIARKMEGE